MIDKFDDPSLTAELQTYFNTGEPGTLTVDTVEDINHVVSFVQAYGAYSPPIELVSTNESAVTASAAQGLALGKLTSIIGEQASKSRLGNATELDPPIDVSNGHSVIFCARIPQPVAWQSGLQYSGPCQRYATDTSGPYVGTSDVQENYKISVRVTDADGRQFAGGGEAIETWVMTTTLANNTGKIYRNGSEVEAGYGLGVKTGFDNISLVGTHTPGSISSTATIHIAIMAIYNGVLTPQNVLDLDELMQYWVTNGHAPNIDSAPSATIHPTNKSVTSPESTSFNCAFSGFPEPTIQWEASNDNGNSWFNAETILSHVAGTTTNTLQVVSTTASDNGVQVQAVGTNNVSPFTDTTTAATLTVTTTIHETSHTFGPVTINDVNATVTWQWSDDDGANWVTEDLSNSRVETTTDAPNNTKTTSLHIDTAVVADSGKIRCLATTPYNTDGEPTFEQTLQVIPAGA